MTVEADYTPIVEQGVLERTAGVLGRFKRRVALAPVEPGFVRVLVDADGLVRGGNQTTAGERYWTAGGRWVKVDVGPHELQFTVPYRERDSSAGYEVTVRVLAQVVDAAEVVRRGLRNVSPFILPLLTSRVAQALPPGQYQVYPDTHHVVALDARRHAVAASLREQLPPGGAFPIDSWLTVQVVDVAVAFDTQTQAHHTDLIGERHKGEVKQATLEAHRPLTEHYRQVVSSPVEISIERALTDPSLENLEKIAEELRQADDRDRELYAAFVQQLIDKNYDPRELPKLMAALQARRGQATGQVVLPAIGETDLRALEGRAGSGAKTSSTAEKPEVGGSGRPDDSAPSGEWSWTD